LKPPIIRAAYEEMGIPIGFEIEAPETFEGETSPS